MRFKAPVLLHKMAVSTALIVSLVVGQSAPVLAQSESNADQSIKASASEISTRIDRLPESVLEDKKAVRSEFDDATRGDPIWGWLLRQNECKIVEKLTKLLERIERLRQKHADAELEELYVALWTLRQDILASLPRGVTCKGFENLGAEPATTIRASDNKHLAFEVAFSAPTLTSVQGAGQTFTQVHTPGAQGLVGTPGEPAIPVWRTLIGLPEGSTPKLKLSRVVPGEDLRLNLAPFQDQAVDADQPAAGGDVLGQAAGEEEDLPKPPMQAFADKPFVYNAESYRKNVTLPPDPCKITPMGQYRDLQIAQLECTTAQYNPVSDRYQLLRGANIEVVFEGGKGHFITERSLHPFESAPQAVSEAVLNKAVIGQYVGKFDVSALPCFGEELLILTHSTFRAAADRLADHKRAKGISTSVFNVGSGVPSRDTAEEIDDFIENRYDDCQVRPSYVLLMGDAEFVPTFYPAGQPDNAGSDFPYSNYVQILFDAFFPDFGTGRIPVDTLAQADTVVDKIVDYESSPPNLGLGNGAPFYTTVGLASQFQGFRMNANGTPLNNQPGTDQRAFVETTEFVRNQLVARGYTAPRLYTRTIDNGGYCLQENASGDCVQTQAPYNGDTTPRRYYNGTLLPAAIGGGSGFVWDADTNDITNAWNAGRFLFLHRDHGWPGGWADPGFGNSNVDGLANGDRLPVVFSVNCASGLFDNETAGGVYGTTAGGVYWAERALRKADGGAIGVIGDTRNSPTWANNALTRGFFDAVWPNTIPAHGGNTSHKRLGDILNWGKVYLATQVGVAQTAGSVSVNDMGYEYHIWHVIGDPTLEMWTSNPHRLVLSPNFASAVRENHEFIKYDVDGATITKLELLRDGSTKALGRAEVRGGQADMTLLANPSEGGRVVYSASLSNAVSVVLKKGSGQEPTPSPTVSPSPTMSPTPSSTPTPTFTPTPTNQPTNN